MYVINIAIIYMFVQFWNGKEKKDPAYEEDSNPIDIDVFPDRSRLVLVVFVP